MVGAPVAAFGDFIGALVAAVGGVVGAPVAAVGDFIGALVAAVGGVVGALVAAVGDFIGALRVRNPSYHRKKRKGYRGSDNPEHDQLSYF